MNKDRLSNDEMWKELQLRVRTEGIQLWRKLICQEELRRKGSETLVYQ